MLPPGAQQPAPSDAPGAKRERGVVGVKRGPSERSKDSARYMH